MKDMNFPIITRDIDIRLVRVSKKLENIVSRNSILINDKATNNDKDFVGVLYTTDNDIDDVPIYEEDVVECDVFNDTINNHINLYRIVWNGREYIGDNHITSVPLHVLIRKGCKVVGSILENIDLYKVIYKNIERIKNVEME